MKNGFVLACERTKEAVFIDPGETWAVHMLSGHAGFDGRDDGVHLQVGDTALLQARDMRRRCVLEGAGEALLIRLRSRT